MDKFEIVEFVAIGSAILAAVALWGAFVVTIGARFF